MERLRGCPCRGQGKGAWRGSGAGCETIQCRVPSATLFTGAPAVNVFGTTRPENLRDVGHRCDETEADATCRAPPQDTDLRCRVVNARVGRGRCTCIWWAPPTSPPPGERWRRRAYVRTRRAGARWTPDHGRAGGGSAARTRVSIRQPPSPTVRIPRWSARLGPADGTAVRPSAGHWSRDPTARSTPSPYATAGGAHRFEARADRRTRLAPDVVRAAAGRTCGAYPGSRVVSCPRPGALSTKRATPLTTDGRAAQTCPDSDNVVRSSMLQEERSCPVTRPNSAGAASPNSPD
jgi:hypothetical protein